VPLPPASQTFDAYERGVGLGLNYTAGAIVLTTLYAAAVTGWAPRRRRPTTATT